MPSVRTTYAKPPRGEDVTPELRALRTEWFAQRVNRPDWASVARGQRGAYDCMRERRAV